MWSLLGFRTESVWNIEFNVSILGTCPCLLWVYSLVKKSILTKRSTTLYPPGLTHKTCSTSPVVIQTQGVAHEFLWHEPRRHYTRNVCERIEASISHSHPVETLKVNVMMVTEETHSENKLLTDSLDPRRKVRLSTLSESLVGRNKKDLKPRNPWTPAVNMVDTSKHQSTDGGSTGTTAQAFLKCPYYFGFILPTDKNLN